MPAPLPDDLIVWPAEFGTRFTVFVDTEEEFDWTKPLDRAERGTEAMNALPDAHRRFAERGVPLNYMIDHPIATCPRSVDILKACLADGVSSVGTQLHPWVNPPHEETVSGPNSFTGNLPVALQAEKLRVLTEAIGTAFGERPLAYRAGRYGIGPDTAALLAAEGYRLDSSMRSGYDYSSERGPDFSAIPNHAFRLGELIELPFTTVNTGLLRAGGAGLYRGLSGISHGRGIASRLGLFSRVSLTPEDMPQHEALEAVRVALGEGLRVLNFSFHSPSVDPGRTPYVRDAAGLAVFFRWWDAVFDLLDSRGVRPASLAEVLDAAGGPGRT
ncbi:WalW protein [Sphingomonas sp. AOB5]|uniref:WalW protein n=1 Tax=Sphingomonas sp. AOB5 TaxID=3034017 RepID=UPI0023F74BDA|nr:WalW protein [Sphingomonas sp. AOB5]MDF7774498.1 WalW protein [Sphingomonas sp. AOB5]